MRQILAAFVLVTALLAGSVSVRGASTAVGETPLTQAGGAWEIHADHQNHVWVTEYYSGELWRMTASDSTFQIYTVGGQPSDATPDGSGSVWWVNGSGLYRMDAGTGSYTYWDITGGSSLWSLAIDVQGGKVWANDYHTGMLYRFDPNESDQLCSIPLETSDQGYLAVTGSQVWVGDTDESRILKFDPDSDTLTRWSLPASHNPNDLAAYDSGSIWYTNAIKNSYGFGGIGRLDTLHNQVMEYSLPSGSETKMLAAVQGNMIWYSEQEQRTLGRLDPNQAAGYLYEDLDYESTTLHPSCSQTGPAGDGTASIQSRNSNWGNTTYTSLVNTDGWLIYQLPVSALPAGIATTGSQGWLVDFGRSLLARFAAAAPPLGSHKVFIPAVTR